MNRECRNCAHARHAAGPNPFGTVGFLLCGREYDANDEPPKVRPDYMCGQFRPYTEKEEDGITAEFAAIKYRLDRLEGKG
jgi:hypothetical protein